MHFVYMLKNELDDLYVGVTQNLEKRLNRHNTKQGADFTKNKGMFTVVFHETYMTLAEARKREIQIKKWRRDKKEILIIRFEKGLNTKL